MQSIAPNAAGFICLDRRIFGSSVAHDPLLFKVWVWAICKAAWRDHPVVYRAETIPVKRGSFIFGRKAAAAELGCTVRSLRTRIEILQKLENLTLKTTNRFSVITVCNYDAYQLPLRENDPQTAQETASRRPADGQQTATTEESKESKQRKEVKTQDPPRGKGFDELLAAWNSLGGPFPHCRPTDKRRAAAKVRLGDEWWCANYPAAMEIMKASPWHRGENDRGWVADIDYFLRPDTVTKILEKGKGVGPVAKQAQYQTVPLPPREEP